MQKQLIIIPVYNEVETLPEVLFEVRKLFDGCVLLVDDGSTDGSIESINNINHERIHIISHDSNQGYGAALISGFRFAIENEYTYVLTMDCDWQHEPRYITEFFEKVREVEIVSGTRYRDVQKPDTEAPADRRAINELITERINHMLSLHITDAFCGFKAYQVGALSKMKLSETGYAFPMQFWVEVYRTRASLVELSVPRIYTGVKRSFGGTLDDPDVRLKHYLNVLELMKGNICRQMSLS